MPVRGDKRAHVLGGLGEGVLETGDGGEDLGEADEDVGEGLDPDGEGGGALALVHVLAARALLVDVVLDDGGGDHGDGSEHETGEHALDGGEPNSLLAEEGVEEVIDDGNEDNQGDGVKVGDDLADVSEMRLMKFEAVELTSLGTPFRVMVLACETRLLFIWL